jgi:hypothetical protein
MRFRDSGLVDQIVGKDVEYWAALKVRSGLVKERGSLRTRGRRAEPDALLPLP